MDYLIYSSLHFLYIISCNFYNIILKKKKEQHLSSTSASVLLLSYQVVSDSWRHHGLRHVRLPCLHCLLEFAQTHVFGEVKYISNLPETSWRSKN